MKCLGNAPEANPSRRDGMIEVLYPNYYIEHHRTRTFKEEYLEFLKRHGGNLDKNTSGTSDADHTVPYGTTIAESED
jgi:hypothetical protein